MTAEKKKPKTKRVLLIILIVFLSLTVALAGTFFALHTIGKKQFHKDDKNIQIDNPSDNIEIDEDSVTYNGSKYTLDPNVVSVLFMGIDKEDINSDKGYGKNGQADAIFIAAFNTKDKSIKIIPIPRETMVDVNLYSKDGEYSGVQLEQLCLAYAYGDTAESCSNNVLTSVRRVLYGINITSYVTMDINGVKTLTDAIGGISLPCLETFDLDGRTYTEGQQLNLDGYLARYYIRFRGNDEYASSRRMLRQKQFLSAIADTAGNQIMSNFTKLGTYYNLLQPYISTNLSFSQITYLASSCLIMNVGSSLDYKSVSGNVSVGEKYVEFVPDQNSLLDTIMDVFYEKCE